MMNSKAIYAGTFDPITLGHLDLVERAARIFPKLYLAVAFNARKQPFFEVEQRLSMVRAAVAGFEQVEVLTFEGLLVDFARSLGVRVLVRGLRAFSDFEYEFEMALTNRQMAPDIETLFLMPKDSYSYISSSVVREIAQAGGDIKPFVPDSVFQTLQRLREKP